MTSKYQEIYQRSIKDPKSFWSEVAENIFWYRKPSKILNSDEPPFYKWFQDGTTNTCYNAVDLHVDNGKGEKVAIIYDSPITKFKEKTTYKQLKDQVVCYDIANDRYVPAYQSCLTEDNELYIAF